MLYTLCSMHRKYAAHCEGLIVLFLLKGSKGEADKHCKSITPDQSVNAEKQSTGCSKRKRKTNKKLFADYDVSTTDQAEDSSDSAGEY